MTVLTMPAPSSQDAPLRPVPWRRMVWVTWRQHRPTLISVPVVLGAVAVFLWIAGLKIHHDYAVLTACHPAASRPGSPRSIRSSRCSPRTAPRG